MLETFGLERAFHATRCADEGYPKPHPDMLLHLMDRLAVKPQSTRLFPLEAFSESLHSLKT